MQDDESLQGRDDNDGMQEFYVDFHGPNDSISSSPSLLFVALIF